MTSWVVPYPNGSTDTTKPTGHSSSTESYRIRLQDFEPTEPLEPDPTVAIVVGIGLRTVTTRNPKLALTLLD